MALIRYLAHSEWLLSWKCFSAPDKIKFDFSPRTFPHALRRALFMLLDPKLVYYSTKLKKFFKSILFTGSFFCSFFGYFWPHLTCCRYLLSVVPTEHEWTPLLRENFLYGCYSFIRFLSFIQVS